MTTESEYLVKSQVIGNKSIRIEFCSKLLKNPHDTLQLYGADVLVKYLSL